MLQKLLAQSLLLTCLLPANALSENEQVDTETPAEAPIEELIKKPAAQSIGTTEYYLPNLVQKRATSLLEHMRLFDREDEIVTLTSNEKSFYGLFLQEASGEPQGGVLILHDNQQHGHWPAVIAPIREYLPLYGWATLSIELPDLPALKQPKRNDTRNQPNDTAQAAIAVDEDGQALIETKELSQAASTNEDEIKDSAGPVSDTEEIIATETNEQDNEPALPRLQALPEQAKSTETLSPNPQIAAIDENLVYQQDNKDRILAAVDYLKSRGQFNLVIVGYGVGAAWAIDYVQSQTQSDPEQKGLTLVTIDALPSRFVPTEMYQQIKELKVPFLDLIHPDQKSSLISGKKRKGIMKRTKNTRYQQIVTPSIASYEEGESPTSRRIRGWLKTHAGGTLVKMNQ